ncbi:MAG: sugar ABC transporter permease [Ruminococcaceae bacterium]|nr:sugar ABC transporter permease [Oscillospiraceae bacterium]
MRKLKQNLSSGHTVAEKRGLLYNLSHYRTPYLLILPALILVLLLCYLPYFGLVLAFKNYDILSGIWGSPWVGFDNFKQIFSNEDMLVAIKNSFIYGVTIQFLGMPFPVVLALLFNELRSVKFKKVVQTVSYLPHFLSWITVIGLFTSMFALEGTFNTFMKSVLGEGYAVKNILYDSKNFLPIIFMTHLWKSVGWSSVVFLAAITGIDPTLYEAATVDGCGKFKQALHITIPCIKGTVLIVFIMSLGSLFNTSFEQVYGFQNVYIQQETDTINTLVYRLGIQNGKYSLATAFGLAQGAVALLLLLMSNFMSKKAFEVSVW